MGLNAFATALLQAGAFVAGQAIDAALFGGGGTTQIGPRLTELDVLSATEGSPIPRIYGRVRTGGEIIWATRLEEKIDKDEDEVGGVLGIGEQTVTTITYRYFANFAVALCEGDIAHVNRIWADGKELDLTAVTYRVYTGSEDQLPDALIEAKEGAGNVPAYRGVAYVVFERLPLERFGNRIPQLNFEILKPLPGRVEEKVLGVNLIPGATEFGYEAQTVKQVSTGSWGAIFVGPENRHVTGGPSDWTVALAHLRAMAPNLKTVNLVVAWFGDDLRCGTCTLRPKVDNKEKDTMPIRWRVAGLERADAEAVSLVNGRPAYGGTPNDTSVISAIQELKSLGLHVNVMPFIMMDVPADNTLPDPYTGEAGQPAYPWRGRITCDPAPGQPGTVDKTAAAGDQVATFVGTAVPAQFTINGSQINYSGPVEWSYRRFILHNAQLAKAAGADGFLIGSEMVGLSTVRDGSASFPFVDALIALAADVRTVLGPAVKIGYAADWSEYHSYRPGDGSGDVYFHLDPLWADANIDFIGIDNYLPMSDWREGLEQLDYDAEAGHTAIYVQDYLQGNIEGGEYYDWFYASPEDRRNQVRTAITDGAHGKPWVFRNKDIRSWWSNQHINRPGGVESGAPTVWVPGSKPIWFTECGCPAVDKGTNQPNVFFDPKSSESFLPYFSNGLRDDFMQRVYLDALITHWDPATGNNPGMIEMDRTCVWAWDMRPFPTFPVDGGTWGDAPNWILGHWLSARSMVSLNDLVRVLAADYGVTDIDVDSLYGSVDGLILDRVMSFREALGQLELMFAFDAVEAGARVRVISKRGLHPVAEITTDDLTDSGQGKVIELVRKQESELPLAAKVRFIDSMADYRSAAVESVKLVSHSERVSEAEVAVAIDTGRAQSAVDSWLQDIWIGREGAGFGLPASRMAIEPGDVVTLAHGPGVRTLRLNQIDELVERRCAARAFDVQVFSPAGAPARSAGPVPPPPPTFIAPAIAFMDLPQIRETDADWAGYVAAFTRPWPGAVNLYRSSSQGDYGFNRQIAAPGDCGETVSPLPAGPTARWDEGTVLRIRLYGSTAQTLSELQVLGGANLLAVENPDGEWELLQFQNAELVGAGLYDVSMLLRGQFGTEGAMRDPVSGSPVPAGARCIIATSALVQVALSRAEVGLPFWYRYGPAGQDLEGDTYDERQHTFTGRGLKPFSPVHVRGRRDPVSGDVTITWIRRTRIGGDNWEQIEVPLGEEAEAYEVDILDGNGVVKRTIATSMPSAVYTAAQQAADFGSPPATLDVAVYQISAAVGRGSKAVAGIIH